MHSRQPGSPSEKHIQQADVSGMAGVQAGTQEVREAMDGRETDGQADR